MQRIRPSLQWQLRSSHNGQLFGGVEVRLPKNFLTTKERIIVLASKQACEGSVLFYNHYLWVSLACALIHPLFALFHITHVGLTYVSYALSISWDCLKDFSQHRVFLSSGHSIGEAFYRVLRRVQFWPVHE